MTEFEKRMLILREREVKALEVQAEAMRRTASIQELERERERHKEAQVAQSRWCGVPHKQQYAPNRFKY